MQQLIYVSDKSSAFRKGDTIDILVVARQRNLERDITGLIVELEAHFFQLIEGQKEEVDDLYQIIKSDNRHQNVRTILTQPVLKREFSEWAMAYTDGRDPQQLEDIMSLLNAYSKNTAFSENDARNIKMLLGNLKGSPS